MRDVVDYEEGNQNMGLDDGSLILVNVWIISDEDMGQMISKIIKPEDLEFTFAIIMPELEQPWDLIDNCKKWFDVLKDGIFKITPKLEYKDMQMLRERIETLYKTYEEPELDEDGNLKNKKRANLKKGDGMDDSLSKNDTSRIDEIDISIMEDQEMMDDLRKEMDLPEGALVTNLFIPVMVVCSKVDLIQHGEAKLKNLLENNLDFIQCSLRKFCLHYGASLVFASTLQPGNQQ
mmetsp:Transcript_15364/g.25975  ORF Transcript_15364/g.25975 Transcript_15364/m.25975 type:complete len:234 (+) Transcript_15364:424-1125(+)